MDPTQSQPIILGGTDTKYVIQHSPLKIYNTRTQNYVEGIRDNQWGHKAVQLEFFSNDGKKLRKKPMVKNLLATCFIPNPNNYKNVSLRDGNRSNLSLDNLFWTRETGRKKGSKNRIVKIKPIPGEIWKEIDSNYRVSSFGRIKDRNEKEIPQSIMTRAGRLHSQVFLQGIGTKRVSIIVARKFISNPEKYEEILHKDGNTVNNCKNNLKWASHGEILAHSKNFPVLWKEINQRPGFFVSNTGVLKDTNGKYSRGRINGSGYLEFYFSCNNHRLAHRVVAKAFIPNNDKLKIIVNHKNGNKKDNRVENLEWCTHAENQRHASSTGLRSNRGQMKPVVQYDLQGNKIAEYESTLQAHRETGISQSEISRVARKGGSTRGFVWQFKLKKDVPRSSIPTRIDALYKQSRGDEIRQFSVDGKLVSIYQSAGKAANASGVNKSGILASCYWWRCHKNGKTKKKSYRQLVGLGLNQEKWAWVQTKDYGLITHLEISQKGKHDSSHKAVQEIDPKTEEVIAEWESYAAAARAIGLKSANSVKAYCYGTKNNKDGRKFRHKE